MLKNRKEETLKQKEKEDKKRKEVLSKLRNLSYFIYVILKIKLEDYQQEIISCIQKDYEEKKKIKDLKNIKQQEIVVLKNRQSGFSYLACAYILSMCILYDDVTAIILSYREDEASSKIDEIMNMYYSLPKFLRKELKTKGRRSVQFYTKEGKKGKKIGSTISSYGATSFRGKKSSGKVIVILDECGFYPPKKENEISNSLNGLIRSQAGSCVMYISTPFKKSGMFYQKWISKKKGVDKFMIHWWDVSFLCNNTKEAHEFAPKMTTEERVNIYGTPKLKDIFERMNIEDFRQEFECCFTDYRDSFFDENMIWESIEDYPFYELEQIKKEIKEEELLSVYMGYDVARNTDKSVMYLVGLTKEEKLKVLYKKEFIKTKLHIQQDFIEQIIIELDDKLDNFYIDKTGMGTQMYDYFLDNYPRIVDADFNFTQNFKIDITTFIRKLIEDNRFIFNGDKDLHKDLLKVEKKNTVLSYTFEVAKESLNDSHGDFYWAVALAIYGYKQKLSKVDNGDFIVIGKFKM